MALVLLAVVLLSIVWRSHGADSAAYTIYRTPSDAPDAQDRSTIPGMAMIGGGADCIDAFSWIISHANGGDLVVLRASGDDVYNSVFYDLSVSINASLNSVTTIVFHSRSASFDNSVLRLVSNAEAVFFSGGDQGKYVELWSDTPLQRLLQEKLATTTMGGTSAGLAIQGQWIYTGTNGSAYSDESLENPYNRYLTFADRFLRIPFLDGTITDTHFGARDRMGRFTAFLARLQTDVVKGRATVHGIALDEETALLLDTTTGQALTVGPSHAYLCHASTLPETCQADQALTYRGLACTRLSGQARETYNLAIWAGEGRQYENNVVDGHFQSNPYGP